MKSLKAIRWSSPIEPVQGPIGDMARARFSETFEATLKLLQHGLSVAVLNQPIKNY
jgi:hypothetical protein